MSKASDPRTGTETVTVALKHPTGIVLEIFEEAISHEPVMGGGTREVRIFRTNGNRFTLNGNRTPFGVAPDFRIVGDYALTPGVPKDVWEKWKEQHKDSPLVLNNLIFAYGSNEKIRDAARESAKLRSGMEAITPDDDPRIPKRKDRNTGKMVSAIQTAEEQPSFPRGVE